MCVRERERERERERRSQPFALFEFRDSKKVRKDAGYGQFFSKIGAYLTWKYKNNTIY